MALHGLTCGEGKSDGIRAKNLCGGRPSGEKIKKHQSHNFSKSLEAKLTDNIDRWIVERGRQKREKNIQNRHFDKLTSLLFIHGHGLSQTC